MYKDITKHLDTSATNYYITHIHIYLTVRCIINCAIMHNNKENKMNRVETIGEMADILQGLTDYDWGCNDMSYDDFVQWAYINITGEQESRYFAHYDCSSAVTSELRDGYIASCVA